MQVHELFNVTPHRAALGFSQDAGGRDVAVALLKATYSFSDTGQLAPVPKLRQVPVFLTDVFDAEPDASPLLFAADLTCDKPGTDVAIHGHAYGRGAESVEIGFRLGSLGKTVIARGPRVLVRMGGARCPSRPEAFAKVGLGYENAYGGARADGAGARLACEFNSVGKGFDPRAAPADVPNLEYPGKPFVRPGQEDLAPAAFGFVPPGWRQRSQFAGTFDGAWMRDRRPLLPSDFDPRFYNAVPQDQVAKPKLRGGETLTICNIHPRMAAISVVVPEERFVASFLVKSRETTTPMVVDTLLLVPDDNLLAITFRASQPLDEDIRYLRAVTIRDTGGEAKAP